MSRIVTPYVYPDIPVIETERLILRAPRAGDEGPWMDFLETDRSRFIGGTLPRERSWRSFGTVIGHWTLRGWGQYVLEDRATGAPIGMVGPWFPEGWPEHELGWTIWSVAHEGRGLAAEAMIPVRLHAYRVLGWTTAVSYIDPQNARSIALAERLGAVRDPDAAWPGEDETLVYRHPGPEALA